MSNHLVFVLSPAHTDGRRGRLLLRGEATNEVAVALRRPAGACLGDVFTFMSQLYFRGKRSYAEAFADPPPGVNGVLVIVPGHGLLDVNTRITLGDLAGIAAVPIHTREPRYREPFERDVHRLAETLAATDRVVFLGSVATDKYLGILTEGLGARPHVPAEFVGRGSMSRGSVLLKSVEAGCQLDYVPVAELARSGASRTADRPLDR